jgi:uncharacterized protein (DUF58 family)
MAKASNLPDNFRLTQPKTWFRTARRIGLTTRLNRRHIYIIPTRFGWLYALLLLGLLTGSINYSLSLGFAMTFLLAGLGSISMLHSWRNMVNLNVALRRAQPVFAGEPAIFEILVSDDSNRARYGIEAKFADQASDMQDIGALGESIFKLVLPSSKRGWLKSPRVVFTTEFPVSFFHVWAYAEIDGQCLVYPAPSQHSLAIPSAHESGSSGNLRNPQGDDDFAGHRTYQFGDSPKRVDWKASSREQGLLTKQFQGEAVTTLWLDWNATVGDNIEQRISQLTRWVLDAEANRLQYGLRLPQMQINPNSGEAHYHQCLSALALM